MSTTPQEREKPVRVLVDNDPVPTSTEKWGKPGWFERNLARGPKTTTWIWDLHALAHDFETHTSDKEEISRKIFSAHFGHLAVVCVWLSGMFWHGAYFSNFTAWMENPLGLKPSAQTVWPVFGQEILNDPSTVAKGFEQGGIVITSGLFHLWRAVGFTTTGQLAAMSIAMLIIAALFLFAGWFHYHKRAPKLEWFQNVESMLNHHLAGLFGLGSLFWTGHLIHVALPVKAQLDAGIAPAQVNPFAGLDYGLMGQYFPKGFGPNGGLGAFFTLNWGQFTDFLTFKGGLEPATGALYLTDIAHHHLAIATLFIIAGHMYRTNWGIGHSIKEMLEAHKGPLTGEGHRGLYEVLTTSWHAQLAINLAMAGSITIIVAHHMYAMNPYPYMGTDYATQISLFTHHMWIGGFLIVGAGAHAAIFMVRDYDPVTNQNNLLDRVLRHRDAIISHLNWVTLFLGFHSFGLYVHNDTMQALGRPRDMFADFAIPLQPVFAQWIQNIHAAAPGGATAPWVGGTSPTWYTGALSSAATLQANQVLALANDKISISPIHLGTADFMVHHIFALCIHVTVLILLKGVLFARSSRLIPDKANLGFRFPCDGPGRGGTCQSSAWDHVFLGLFWMYNTISVVIFHFSWKMQSDVWGTVDRSTGAVNHIIGNTDVLLGGQTVALSQYAASSININGWLRDFLWAQSSAVINSYGGPLSAYGLMFLGAHFIWAFSLMFLFSGRGYWQELIESIVWAHNKLKVAPAIQPRALSITQGRAVGVAHYLLGGIATTWAFFLARFLALP
ncbi:photosystem I core protein PsaA [Gloeobacter violaceus]|uniref:Photosystem I P700 chlorophyll a apoprotein A1 n=1 Tax=Gloeobacter violaceus (strain ATCC 29082 / PCC 7421) TaxID=251221 RepID=PSAA_GLOVI|nr:photosystem I core protein PsaA [Gloeobacter violaceus]Q7NFT6.1 RecName: Full=Photosystem I P700 chlorophyll a apoprotein A1; AltName: Full=PsaA [Gloeobacter violaceus PCC 7421]7F4V_aA Chain aA, Photosystem I P700 chlorophyll a apoprotein A1 [Gloeobacter violaceus PCC 7421]7F4V_bA Chain bA, Photosystem I P700 chlorophyll a apoprotein A1 [Gloeobacter violaceus PCC 7421]7F4V_cA Chain cA, Photosystem I P700 chlorophyll a apoprotein A1 [Gloeobacter violaceus PCC 7421]BAC91379.1 Photosystem I P7